MTVSEPSAGAVRAAIAIRKFVSEKSIASAMFIDGQGTNTASDNMIRIPAEIIAREIGTERAEPSRGAPSWSKTMAEVQPCGHTNAQHLYHDSGDIKIDLSACSASGPPSTGQASGGVTAGAPTASAAPEPGRGAPDAEHRHECGFDGIHDICRCVICGHDWRHGDLSYKLVDATFWPHPQSGIPMVKRASGRTIPDLTKREHVCEYQQSVKPRESGHVVLLEALRKLTEKMKLIHNDPRYMRIWVRAMLHGDNYDGPNYEAELREAEAAIKQAERT